MKQHQPQQRAEQDYFWDADLPFKKQDQVDHSDEDGLRADGGVDDIVGLAEGYDHADDQPDAHRAHSGKNFLHAVTFLEFLKEDGGHGSYGKGGSQDAQIGDDRSRDSGGFDSGKGSAV